MSRIPIEIEKIKKTLFCNRMIDGIGTVLEPTSDERTEYIISIIETGQNWTKTIRCGLKDLTKFRDELTTIIETSTTAEKLGISSERANIIDKHNETDEICSNCRYKLSNYCLTCLFDLQSPLERKLFLELSKNHVRFETQYPLNWKGENISIRGKSFNNPKNNFRDVLTVADFFIEKRGVKLCVYTDGHTYHERTEEQAQRDKRIDRKLQELGFQVLRYTGKDVNENLESIVTEIKQWIEKPAYNNG